MSRVSQEHLDARRRQILDGARRCFIAKGFHTASMQDVLAEVGLSAGAVYRYFRSKDQLIGEIATDMMGRVAAAFAAAQDADPLPEPEELLGCVFDASLLGEVPDAAKLTIQVWGEATRNPVLSEQLEAGYLGVVAELSRYAEELRRQGRLPQDTVPEEVARTIVGLVQGAMVQRALFDGTTVGSFRGGLRALTGSTTWAGAPDGR